MSEPEIRVALALVRRGDRWLVALRAPGRIFAGMWEFPGGRIEPGESPAEAATREVMEEAGLLVDPVADRGKVTTAHAGQTVILHLVECRPIRGEASATSPAVSEVRWIKTADLGKLEMPPANAEIIAKLTAQGPQNGSNGP